MKAPEIEPQFKAPAVDDELQLTPYQRAIAVAVSRKPVYQGYATDTVHLPRAPHGPGGVGRLEGHRDPDPRMAQVDRRRARNRIARKSRRINRIAGAR